MQLGLLVSEQPGDILAHIRSGRRQALDSEIQKTASFGEKTATNVDGVETCWNKIEKSGETRTPDKWHCFKSIQLRDTQGIFDPLNDVVTVSFRTFFISTPGRASRMASWHKVEACQPPWHPDLEAEHRLEPTEIC